MPSAFYQNFVPNPSALQQLSLTSPKAVSGVSPHSFHNRQTRPVLRVCRTSAPGEVEERPRGPTGEPRDAPGCGTSRAEHTAGGEVVSLHVLP